MIPNIHAVVSALRPHMYKAAIVAFSAATLGSAGGCNVFDLPTARGPLNTTTPHVAGAPIKVESRNGFVQIVAEPALSEVRIDATITCSGQTREEAGDRLAKTRLDVARDTARTLTIKPVFPGGAKDNDGASFIIRLPDASGVKVDTSNGAVTLAGLGGALSIETSNGSVSVNDHTGAAGIETSNGSITLARLQGDLVARTSNANVIATAVNGRAIVDSSNGSITLDLAPTVAGPITLHTSNGSINVTVGKAFAGDVALNTSNGVVTVAGDGVQSARTGQSDAVVHIGEGGANSKVRTSNGNITFTISK